MTTTIDRDLREYSLGELAAMYGRDDETDALITAECDRRDKAGVRRQAAHKARLADPVRQAWEEAAYAQYRAAEAECKGALLSHAGHEAADKIARALGSNADLATWPWPRLWTGPQWEADLYASWELARYWEAHPRMTFTQYREQIARQEEAYRNDQLDRDEARGVRRFASEGQEGARGRGVGARDAVPGPDATRRAQGFPGTGSVAGPGRFVRGGRMTPDQAARDARRADIHQRAQAARGEPADPAPTAAVAVPSGSALVRAGQPAVDGAQALGYARQFLAHFAIWPSEAALTVATLWAGHTHCRDAAKALVFLSTPRLLFSSAEPGSGKSHAMKLVSRLCPDPVIFTEPSEPAMAHSIGEHQTIGLEEVDVFFGTGNRKAAVRAIINDGYTPDGQWARVRNGQTHKISTFGPLMMAGLDKVESGTSGVLAATLSRCIRIKMVRAPEDYRAPRYDRQARYAATLISERLTQWAAQNLEALGTHVPEMYEIGNRMAELWEPVLTVADLAGGPWPEMARDAADELITTGGMPAEDEDRAAQLDAIMADWGTGEEEF